MTNEPRKDFKLAKIDPDLLTPVKIEAAKDGISIKRWVSTVIRDELNKRYAHVFDVKPVKKP